MATHRKEYSTKISSGNNVNIFNLDENDNNYQYTLTQIFVGTDGNNATFKINDGPTMTMPSGKHYVLNMWKVEVTNGEVVVYGDKTQNPID